MSFETSRPEISAIDKAAIADRLLAFGIDLSLWGEGGAKTLDHLVREIECGEAELVECNGELTRRITALGIDVCCRTADGMKILRQSHQEFRDNRVRESHISTSIGEKLKPGEDETEGVMRALREELGIDGIVTAGRVGEELLERPSRSYPGLSTKLRLIAYAVLIDPGNYNPDGFKECQDDKITYFVWD